MYAAPDNAEIRIKQRVTCDISANACSKQNFGWLLTQTIYKTQELYGRNVFGNRKKNIIAISPRRRHAFKHAVAEVYGLFDVNWKEAVNGINTGLRKMKRRLPFTAVDGNIHWNSIRKNTCELFCVFVYTWYMYWLVIKSTCTYYLLQVQNDIHIEALCVRLNYLFLNCFKPSIIALLI